MMRYNVRIGEKTYSVEIEDINARPVIARVDGEQVEVMPENGTETPVGKEAGTIKPMVESQAADLNPVPVAAAAPHPALSGNTISAPLPGTVVEVFVKSGDQVAAGQIVLVIEAMKMKNSIRSTWSGTIGEVFVSAGQTVAHKQALVKFADLGEASWM